MPHPLEAPTTAFINIVVVVPANNEEKLLPDCLRALQLAAAQVRVPVEVVVVLDDCDDSSAVVAERAGQVLDLNLHLVSVTARNVGVARVAGFRHAIDRAGTAGRWLATTDADSLVPPDWFQRQLSHAATGAAVVAGTVTVRDWADRPVQIRELAETAYHRGPHRHIHGANLSFTAEAYVAVGGFPLLATGEDVGLVAAFTAANIAVCWASDLPVITSARVISRAPLGFSHYLTNLDLTALPDDDENARRASRLQTKPLSGRAVQGSTC